VKLLLSRKMVNFDLLLHWTTRMANLTDFTLEI
jgi:hypothetical protein